MNEINQNGYYKWEIFVLISNTQESCKDVSRKTLARINKNG